MTRFNKEILDAALLPIYRMIFSFTCNQQFSHFSKTPKQYQKKMYQNGIV
jgi:hypothetical protein